LLGAALEGCATSRLKKVSSIVRQVPDELALEMTLVENIQREDLNAIEAARAFERLMDEFQLTQNRWRNALAKIAQRLRKCDSPAETGTDHSGLD